MIRLELTFTLINNTVGLDAAEPWVLLCQNLTLILPTVQFNLQQVDQRSGCHMLVMLMYANVTSNCKPQAKMRSGHMRFVFHFQTCNLYTKPTATQVVLSAFVRFDAALWSHKMNYTTVFTYAAAPTKSRLWCVKSAHFPFWKMSFFFCLCSKHD